VSGKTQWDKYNAPDSNRKGSKNRGEQKGGETETVPKINSKTAGPTVKRYDRRAGKGRPGRDGRGKQTVNAGGIIR